MKIRDFALVGVFALTMTPALAQTPGSLNVFGVVDKIDATSIVVKKEDGVLATFPLASKLVVIQNKSATLADIKPNDFVASAAVRKEDGKLHSTELRIFPDAMRGIGEGQRPMNDARNQTMTNATVTGAAVVGGSNNIKVKFDGGESELILDPGVPVTRMDTVDKSTVKPAMKVRVQGPPPADGGTVNRITILAQ